MEQKQRNQYQDAAKSLTKGTMEVSEVAVAIIVILVILVVIGIIWTVKTGQETWITRLFNLKPWLNP